MSTPIEPTNQSQPESSTTLEGPLAPAQAGAEASAEGSQEAHSAASSEGSQEAHSAPESYSAPQAEPANEGETGQGANSAPPVQSEAVPMDDDDASEYSASLAAHRDFSAPATAETEPWDSGGVVRIPEDPMGEAPQRDLSPTAASGPTAPPSVETNSPTDSGAPSDPNNIVSAPEEPAQAASQETEAPGDGVDTGDQQDTGGLPRDGKELLAASHEEDTAAEIDPELEPESLVPDLDLAPGDDAIDHPWPGHEGGDHAAAHTSAEQNAGAEEYGRPPADLAADEPGDEAAWQPEPVSQDFDKTWQRIEDAFTQKQTLTAMVVDRVKGGLVVDIGMQGFVPGSQVGSGKMHDLDRYIGRPLKLRITDLDRERQRVVLSARVVQDEEHLKRKRETLETLSVGMIADGVVRRLTDFGAFVDIGGIDGLLHVSEMSWSRVKHPKEAVSPGEHVKVKVLKISDDRKKISLGMRQLLPDPWNGIDQQFKVGSMVTGRVVRVVPFGAFVQVKDGVDAILPNSEVSARKPKAEELPQVGDTVNAKVIEVRPEARRMTLSIRKIQEEQEKKEYREHVQSQPTKKTTIGDMFGDILNDWQGDTEG